MARNREGAAARQRDLPLRERGGIPPRRRRGGGALEESAARGDGPRVFARSHPELRLSLDSDGGNLRFSAIGNGECAHQLSAVESRGAPELLEPRRRYSPRDLA